MTYDIENGQNNSRDCGWNSNRSSFEYLCDWSRNSAINHSSIGATIRVDLREVKNG